MLCGNCRCIYYLMDECYAGYSKKLVPYIFSNDIEESVNKCISFKNGPGIVFGIKVDENKNDAS